MRRAHLFQRVNGLLRAALLHHADDRIHNHNHQDDNRVHKIPIRLQKGGRKGDDRRNQEDNHHEICKLREKPPEEALPFRLLELIFPILPLPLLHLFRR